MSGNIAKTMTSNRKQFTVTSEMLTAVAHDQNLLLFCFAINIKNHLMTGLMENREFCLPRISMFPSTYRSLGKHWDSQETKFTVLQGTSH